MGNHEVMWGIAPIGWRNDDLPELGAEHTVQQVLSDIVVAGFQGTEVGGFFPPPTVLNKELKLRSLKIAGKWFSSFIVRDGIEKASQAFREHCGFLKEVNAAVAVVSEQTHSIQGLEKNVYTEKPYFTDVEWDLVCEGLNEFGQIANDYNLKLVYHHHMGTGIQTIKEVNRLMDNTDPAYVHLLYDTGHIYVSDGDYLSLLKKHIKRIKHVHFKDVRQNVLEKCKVEGKSFIGSFLDGLFTVPGDGCIDFVPVFERLLENKYTGWIIIEAEQDPNVAHPLEYALLARDYINNKLLEVIDSKV